LAAPSLLTKRVIQPSGATVKHLAAMAALIAVSIVATDACA